MLESGLVYCILRMVQSTGSININSSICVAAEPGSVDHSIIIVSIMAFCFLLRSCFENQSDSTGVSFSLYKCASTLFIDILTAAVAGALLPIHNIMAILEDDVVGPES